jgi:hypothetical protein
MAKPRKYIVPASGDPTLHLISRCVRRARLIGGEDGELGALHHRKLWIENRLVQLTQWFGVEGLTYAIMDNHFHLVVTMRRSWVESWSDEIVVRKWVEVFPPKRFLGANGEQAKEVFIQNELKTPRKIAEFRRRLGDCGWLMKALKEPISRQANKEDEAKGAFWDARYKSVHLADEGAILACMAYVDLNPLRAGKAKTIEAQTHAGIEQRIKEAQAKQAENKRKFTEWRDAQEKLRLESSEDEGRKAKFKPVAFMRERSWLRPMDGEGEGEDKTAFFKGKSLTLAAYISLLEFTAQKKKKNKASMSQELTGALERLGLVNPEETLDRLWWQMKSKRPSLRLAAA